jgi:hypothetical protein
MELFSPVHSRLEIVSFSARPEFSMGLHFGDKLQKSSPIVPKTVFHYMPFYFPLVNP